LVQSGNLLVEIMYYFLFLFYFLSTRNSWVLSCHPEHHEAFFVTQNLTRPFLSTRNLWGLSCHPETFWGLYHKPNRNKRKMVCVIIDVLELGY